MGGLFSSGSGKNQQNAALKEWQDLQLPDVEQMKIQLESLVQQGEMTPEEAEAMLMGDTAMSGISLDPKLKEAQMNALSQLMDIGEGGMTLTDQANLAKIQNQELSAQRGQREALMQNAQARGIAGSGLDMMNQMINQQESATRQSQKGLDVAAMAQERALNALIQGGGMAGNMEQADFGRQAQVAGAKDAISRFNTETQNQMNMNNVNSRNQAQAQNLGERQRIADQNASQRNQAQQYNKSLAQQDFDNRAAKTAGLSGQYSQIAQQRQQQRGQDIGFIGGLIGAGAQAYGAKGKKDGGLVEGEDTGYDTEPHMLQPGEMVVKKEDVPDYLAKAHTDENGKFDAAGFLDQLTGYKYNYSGKKEKK